MNKIIEKIYSHLFSRIELQKDFPLILPDIEVDNLKVKDWEFEIKTYHFEGKKPYPVFQYTNPNGKGQYIFHSKTIDELIEYLKDFKII
jgi:hypothetical protein